MRSLTILILSVILAACNHHDNNVPVNRPGTAEPVESPELADGSMRISGPVLTMRYDDGGILFSHGDDGTVSAVRLSDEARFEFDPSKPSLRVNGVEIPLTTAETVKETDACRWFRLTTPDHQDPIYIVIEGL